MANFNKVILVGNLTRDPQLSYLPNQTPVAEIGMAINHRWRDAQGNQKEDVCFVDCRVYGKQAETFCQYVSKGKQVLVEGRLQYSTWEGKDGQKRSKHRVLVDRFQFLSAPGGGPGAPAGGQARPAAQRPAPPPPQQGAAEQEENPEPPPYEGDAPAGEDIPF